MDSSYYRYYVICNSNDMYWCGPYGDWTTDIEAAQQFKVPWMIPKPCFPTNCRYKWQEIEMSIPTIKGDCND